MPTCPNCGAVRARPERACPRCGARGRSAPDAQGAERSGRSYERAGFGGGLDAEAQRRVVQRYLREDAPPARPAGPAPEPVRVAERRRPARIEGAVAPAPRRKAPARRAPVPGSGEWWRSELRSGDVAGPAPRVEAVAPVGGALPPPPPAAAQPRRAPDVIPARLPSSARLPSPSLPSLEDLRAPHLAAAALALAAVVVAGLLLLPGRDPVTLDGERALDPPTAVDPGPPPSPGGEDVPGAAPGAPDAPVEDPEVPVDAPGVIPARDLLLRVNAEREGRGLHPLQPDVDLERVALEHVGEMIERERLFHTPNRGLARRVTNWQLLAESIGVGPSVPALLDAFLNSDVDRRNLLDDEFWHVGIAAVQQGRRLWVTMLFTDESDPGTTLP